MTIQVVAVVDESWSMTSKKTAVIEGINTFIDEQIKTGEDAEFTLIYFNREFKMVKYRIPMKDAEHITELTYTPSGDTALLDAIGTTLEQFKHLQEMHPDSVSGVVIAVMTDGKENASDKYTNASIKELTKEAEEKYKWQINYLGANQDAFATARAMGISNAYNFADTVSGVKGSMKLMSASSSLYRATLGEASHAYASANMGDWENTIAIAKTEGIK